MANLIIICGPQAVGKMIVAESLRDKLRYNMMIKQDLKGETPHRMEKKASKKDIAWSKANLLKRYRKP